MSNTKSGSCVKINTEVKEMSGAERREKIIEYIKEIKLKEISQVCTNIFNETNNL